MTKEYTVTLNSETRFYFDRVLHANHKEIVYTTIITQKVFTIYLIANFIKSFEALHSSLTFVCFKQRSGLRVSLHTLHLSILRGHLSALRGPNISFFRASCFNG